MPLIVSTKETFVFVLLPQFIGAKYPSCFIQHLLLALSWLSVSRTHVPCAGETGWEIRRILAGRYDAATVAGMTQLQ